jgi:pimeloyl-ACP methyl ester carboxylesterase
MKVTLFAQVPYCYVPEGFEDSCGPAGVIDDCGHVMQADQPERTWAATGSFLAAA